jgi:hypothetical protein
VKWLEYQKRQPTKDELKAWFTGKYKSIGIVTGEISGLTVIDFDSEEAHGLAEQLGMSGGPVVRTGKGYHHYFHYKHGSRNWQKRPDLPGIDLRSEGGYVVGPPSPHPDHGNRPYKWVAREGLNEAPDWLFKSKATDITELYKGSSEGSRNGNMARIVGKLAYSELVIADCLEICLLLNKRNTPPLTEAQVKATVDSVYKAHRRNNPKAEITWQSLGSIETQSWEWLWRGMVPKGAVTVLAGDGGLGKGWINLDIHLGLSAGQLFKDKMRPMASLMFNSQDSPDKTIKPRLEKIQRLREHGNMDLIFYCDTYIPFSAQGINRLKDEVHKVEDVSGTKVGYISVDPLSDYLGPGVSLNKTEEMSPWIMMFQMLARELDLSQMFLHHYNKTLGSRGVHRVSGAGLVNASRSTLQVVHNSDLTQRAVTQTKINDGPKQKSIGYRIDDHGLHWLGASTLNEEELVAAEYKDKPKKESALIMLEEILANGSVPSEVVIREAKHLGFSKKTLHTAKEQLGVISTPVYDGNKIDHWELSLPKEEM